MKHYYGTVKEKDGSIHGRAYHWNTTGSKEIVVYYGPGRTQHEDAFDDVGEWLDENNIDAEME